MRSKRTLIYLAAGVAALAIMAAVFSYLFSSSPLGKGRTGSAHLPSLYNADAEIKEATANLRAKPEKAQIISGMNSAANGIVLTFDGLADAATTRQLLDLLQRYDAKATFFVAGMRAAEETELVSEIVKAGHRVENYSLSGRIALEKLPQEELVQELCTAQKIIKVTSNSSPVFLKAEGTVYTDNLLQVAKACGLAAAVKSDKVLEARSLQSYEAAVGYVRKIQKGSIVSFRLERPKAEKLPAVKISEQQPAKDKQPGLKELNKDSAKDSGEKEILKTVELFLQACKNEQVSTVFLEVPKPQLAAASWSENLLAELALLQEKAGELIGCKTAYATPVREGLEELRVKNNGRLATEIKTIHTTERAINYSFAGIANEVSLNAVLTALEKLNGKATFFVTEKDINKYPQAIAKIINSGNEIGIATVFNEGDNFYTEAAEILRCDELLRTKFGITTDIVKQLWGTVPEETREAASATGKYLVGQVYTITKKQHKDYNSAQAIRKELFPKGITSFSIGQQIFFRLDFYTNPLMCSELLHELQSTMVDNIAYATSSDNTGINPKNDSSYSLKTVGEMLHNDRYTYEYPVQEAKVPQHLRSDFRSFKVADDNLIDLINKRFIGKGGSNSVDKAPGFSRQEVKRLDAAGLVHTNDNVIFLTFDDWGGDDAINKLLYVLRKHNAPATFFIRTNNVHYNPNLLRAIAADGHEIGSHTDKHLLMTKYDSNTKNYVSIVNRDEYMLDLQESYNKLARVVGDVEVNGKYSLTRFFRPPTLVISKTGLECVLASGFEYIIEGYSTKDYIAKSYLKIRYSIDKQLYRDDGSLRKGSIFVLHMGNASADIAAEALDFILTRNEQKSDADPGKFKVGRLSDYLRDGYDQGNPKKSLRLEAERKLALIQQNR
ncbi:MAG: polysaccharide deacetylase family protein [Negativicutes bacterium]|nr:polysaccharide deacetylase family protein [Negativicutes bacterium]